MKISLLTCTLASQQGCLAHQKNTSGPNPPLCFLCCERLREGEMQSELCAGTPRPPAVACRCGGQLMSWRDGGEMMFDETFEPFSCDAIRAAVTRRPRLHPLRSGWEFKHFLFPTGYQIQYMLIKKKWRMFSGKPLRSKCRLHSSHTDFVFSNKQLSSPGLFLTLSLWCYQRVMHCSIYKV